MSDDNPDNLEPAEEMMAEVPGAELSDAEADDIFSAAWEGDDDGEAEGGKDAAPDRGSDGDGVTRLDEARERRASSDGGQWRTTFTAAAAVLIATAGAWFGYRWIADDGADYTGVKSPAEAPDVELIPLAGRMESGRPNIGDRLDEGARLERGVRVLFRYRLSRRASVVLLGQQQGGEVEVLWRSESPRPARESEVRADGRALALDPSRYEGAFRLAMVAAPDDGIAKATGVDALAETTLRKTCPSCGVDIVQLQAP